MSISLDALCMAWQDWSYSSDQSEDGWQSDFPEWTSLISQACAAMLDSELQVSRYQQIEFCWRISEEIEDLADCAVEHIDDCWPLLTRLARSHFAAVRWQIYSVLASGGDKAKPYLRQRRRDLGQIRLASGTRRP